VNTNRWMRCGILFALCLALTSCSQSKERPTHIVLGRLTFENKPMGKALISFYSIDPNDRKEPSHATADEEGRYKMETYRKGDGVPAGDYIVTIFWPGPKPKKATTDPDDADSGAPDRLKYAYASATTSKLRATVKPGQDNEINFNLP
jgi:hypothetical protein